MWNIFWWLSVATIAATVILTIMLTKRKLSHIKPVYMLMAGSFVGTVFMLYPYYYSILGNDNSGWFKTLFVTLQNAIRVYTIDSEFVSNMHDVMESLDYVQPLLIDAYSALGAVLYIAAPLMTFGFVLSFFKGVTARLKHIFHLPAEAYVFSHVTAKSLAIAESIREKDKKAVLVFARASYDADGVDEELTDRIKTLDGIMYKDEIAAIVIPWKKYKKHSVKFFCITENESLCISESIQLIKKYKDRSNAVVYMFATGSESELVLNNLDRGKLKVRRIDPVNAIINHILYTDGIQLYDNATPTDNGKKEISVLIVGMGALGTEMTKSLAWYCQMDGYCLRINAVDCRSDARERFSAMCPDLMNEKYNGKYIKGDVNADINIASHNVKTSSFNDFVKSVGNITHVFVSLGSDSLNVETAVNL